jgi:hypothetical protein
VACQFRLEESYSEPYRGGVNHDDLQTYHDAGCRRIGHGYGINRTGKPMTAGVLQRLDPTIRIRQ